MPIVVKFALTGTGGGLFTSFLLSRLNSRFLMCWAVKGGGDLLEVHLTRRERSKAASIGCLLEGWTTGDMEQRGEAPGAPECYKDQ